MEQVLFNSNRLRTQILPQIEQMVQNYRQNIARFNQKQLKQFDDVIESQSNKLQDIKTNIQAQQAAISFLKHKIEVSHTEEPPITESSKLHTRLKEYQKVSIQLCRALKYYQSRLGLSLKKLPNSGLRLSFDYIKRDMNNIQHSVTFSLQNTTYRLLNCTPQIEGIQNLVQILNQTNDLSRFVKDLRKAFVNLYVN